MLRVCLLQIHSSKAGVGCDDIALHSLGTTDLTLRFIVQGEWVRARTERPVTTHHVLEAIEKGITQNATHEGRKYGALLVSGKRSEGDRDVNSGVMICMDRRNRVAITVKHQWRR